VCVCVCVCVWSVATGSAKGRGYTHTHTHTHTHTQWLQGLRKGADRVTSLLTAGVAALNPVSSAVSSTIIEALGCVLCVSVCASEPIHHRGSRVSVCVFVCTACVSLSCLWLYLRLFPCQWLCLCVCVYTHTSIPVAWSV